MFHLPSPCCRANRPGTSEFFPECRAYQTTGVRFSAVCPSWQLFFFDASFDDASDTVRNWGRFEIRAVDANDGNVTRSQAIACTIIEENKIVPDGLQPLKLRIQPHSDRLSVPDGFGKFRERFHPWQPYAILDKKTLPIFPGRMKKFFLGLLHQSEIVRKNHDAGGVRVRPVCLKSHLEHDARF